MFEALTYPFEWQREDRFERHLWVAVLSPGASPRLQGGRALGRMSEKSLCQEGPVEEAVGLEAVGL